VRASKAATIATVGARFGRWTVTGEPVRGEHGAMVMCQCECGTEKLVHRGNLVRGGTKQCSACGKKDSGTKRTKHGYNRRGKVAPEYFVWREMKSRCENSWHRYFHNYGGRGISLCERWAAFEAFIEDMGERPSRVHTLERVDNDKGYSPENCKWATRREQAQNTRRNRMITIDGETLCLAEWARRSTVSWATIRSRLENGIEPKQAVFGDVQ
jgi:hypothetical protein